MECGCGAGPDTEVLLSLGCKVIAVDIAGVDIAKRNLKNNPNVQFVQDSIDNLHLKKSAFDIVICHRVLQHTPDPIKTLSHILQFVKEDGAVFIHSYSDNPIQRFRWKYFLRPFTRRLKPDVLYHIITSYATPLYYLTSLTGKSSLGQVLNHFFIPFLNYSNYKKFKGKNNQFLIEYGIHDTFDALSPRYDNPINSKVMGRIAKKYLTREFEIVSTPTINIIRTIIKRNQN